MAFPLVLRLPLPYSQRCKLSPEAKKRIADSIARKVTAKVPPSMELSVSMSFYGKWRKKDGSLLRRDHLNYVHPLIDILAKALGTDDKQVVHWGDIWKHHRPGDEYVIVTLYPLGTQPKRQQPQHPSAMASV
jgi:Holliday junction resolvase RusA-like endonuclease